MKLFRVTNGWFGNGEVHVLVVADSEQTALELATEKFKSENTGLKKLHDENYWNKLEAQLINDNLDNQWVGEVND